MHPPHTHSRPTPDTQREFAARYDQDVRKVTSFADLRPELVGAVERLIDFVAPPE